MIRFDFEFGVKLKTNQSKTNKPKTSTLNEILIKMDKDLNKSCPEDRIFDTGQNSNFEEKYQSYIPIGRANI